MPKVSVILPNYNYARYLKERIRSILNQTETDLELIYLDDASKDESNQIAESFHDPRMQTHPFAKNSGTVYQRWNDGAAMARGDWLWFAGADDTAHPDFLATLLRLADEHPSASLIYSRPMTIDMQGRILNTYSHFHPAEMKQLRGSYFQRGYQEAVFMTEACTITTASSLLIRRSAFEQEKGFDIRLWGVADWDLYLKILHKHDIACTAEPVSCYRFHRTTVSTTTKAIVLAITNAYCVACAYQRMQHDSRYSPEMKALALRRAKARIFDALTDPAATIPEELSFAAAAIYEVIPDKRLCKK